MYDHYRDIYENRASQYDMMVSREDCEGNILPALENIRPLQGLDIVEFGAGTGRLTRLLAPVVGSIHAFDISPHMLEVAEKRLREMGLENWELYVAEHSTLPTDDDFFDLALAGWTFSHMISQYPGNWREEIGKALNEIARVLKPDGTAIILETLGTGQETPAPPSPHLADYYAWLETDHGFSATWVRTDYRFDSVQQADELTRFFFGDELADRIVREAWTIVPECTGIWWRRMS